MIWRSEKRYPIPFYKVGTKVYYKRADLLTWLESRKRDGQEEK